MLQIILDICEQKGYIRLCLVDALQTDINHVHKALPFGRY